MERQDANALPLEKGRDLTKLVDAVERPVPESYWEIFWVDKVQDHD